MVVNNLFNHKSKTSKSTKRILNPLQQTHTHKTALTVLSAEVY